MRRFPSAALAAAALALALVAAEEEPQPPVPGSLPVTFYLHGAQPAGEADGLPGDPFKRMDTAAPNGSEPKSMWVTNYVAGPNTTCSGNSLLPTWEGYVEGTAVGDITVTIPTVAAVSNVTVELFADGAGGCESSVGSTGYQPPFAHASAAVPPGAGEVVVTFEDVEQALTYNLVLMLYASGPADQTRVLYDAAGYEARVELWCLPEDGEADCNTE